MSKEREQLRQEILEKVKQYFQLVQSAKNIPFAPGQTFIQYSGPVFDGQEFVNAVDTLLGENICLGPYGQKFEKLMCQFFKSHDFIMVNSGSSANLVAVTTLCSKRLPGHLNKGDEVITPAVTFPTTLTPILQNGLIPVFVDCELGTYNVDPDLMEGAVSPKTRAIMVPHTLGNPVDLDRLMALVKKYNLFLVEDACDSLGSTFDGQLVGTFGDLATLSMYPAHHITCGEGGGVVANRALTGKIARSIRDWGRDCWCPPGKNNTCKKRFSRKSGDLPFGYDHKFVYSELGYNLKPADTQAAIAVAQYAKLPFIFEARRRNFHRLYEGLKDLQDYLILPRWHPKSDPCWFGFPITLQKEVSRNDVIQWLQEAKIDTRLIFAGNILRQPGFKGIPCRIYGNLERTDTIMMQSFFLGVYPRIKEEMIDFIVEHLHSFFRQRRLPVAGLVEKRQVMASGS